MSSNEYSTENVGCRNEKSGKAPSQAAECDVGLALNMLNPETTHPKKMDFIFDPSLYHHSQHRASIDFGGGSGGGGRLLFDNSMATSSHIVSGTSFSNPTGGSEMQKMLFTASQLQEFENQTMIYKHIMSSNPIPPQMLLPLSTQYNRSDSEPWRCRRTDGKKWRCSRDVMRDQKYCERHAHKNRPRSRKPVETQSLNTKNLNNKDNYHSLLPPTPSMPTSCQQSRCTEWFMRGGTIPLSSSQQRIQKPMPSPSVGSKSDHLFQNLEGNHQALVDVDNCSLSLMQPGGDDACVDQDFFQMGIGMLNADGSNPQSQLMPHGSWLGGPLGEALCPGVVSSLNQPTNVTSPNDSSHGLC
ncbi:putative transcription factor interactor and regulator C3H-WRC/GRF family [Helianthus debilis subsp. tardiflorus]